MAIEELTQISELENLPLDWDCKIADEICDKISKGTTPPKSEILEKGNIPFLRVNNLSFNGVLDKSSDFIFVTKEAHEKFLARSKAYPNDILMNIVGPPLGKTTLLDDLYSEYNMNQAIVFYRLKKDIVDKRYFLAYLNSHNAQGWLQARSKKTSGQQNLTIELCKQLPIPLPKISEQKKIAEILSTWDKAIETVEKLVANSQQQKKALMQQLLTGQKRLLDENGVKFGDEWEIGNLGKLCSLKGGSAFKESFQGETVGEIPFIKVSDMNLIGNEKNIINANNWVSEETAKTMKSTIFPKNVIVFAKVGAALLLNRRRILVRPTIIDNNMMAAIPNKNVNLDFLFHLLSSIDFARFVQEGAIPSVNQSDLASFKVKFPIEKEQEKIAQVLTLTDREIDLYKEQLDKLKLEKKSLMQQLLTGQKRVKID